MKKDGVSGMVNSITLGIMLLSIAVILYLLTLLKKRKEEYNNSIIKITKGKERLHHRTKNSMQVMIGLLDMQALKTQNLHYQKIFSSNVDRLKSMSILYDHLYSNLEHDTLDLKPILQDTINILQKSTSNSLQSDIDTLHLRMRECTTMTLILNESLSNAIEYAYPDKDGTIEISLKRIDQEFYRLLIIDKGIGFNITNTPQTLGLKLINSLVKSLPQGTITIQSKKPKIGTTVEVIFKGGDK